MQLFTCLRMSQNAAITPTPTTYIMHAKMALMCFFTLLMGHIHLTILMYCVVSDYVIWWKLRIRGGKKPFQKYTSNTL